MSSNRHLSFLRKVLLVLVVVNFFGVARPVYATPANAPTAAPGDIETSIMEVAKKVGQILALISLVLAALAALGGQQILQTLGLPVERGALMKVFAGVVLLGFAPSIVEWLFNNLL